VINRVFFPQGGGGGGPKLKAELELKEGEKWFGRNSRSKRGRFQDQKVPGEKRFGSDGGISNMREGKIEKTKTTSGQGGYPGRSHTVASRSKVNNLDKRRKYRIMVGGNPCTSVVKIRVKGGGKLKTLISPDNEKEIQSVFKKPNITQKKKLKKKTQPSQGKEKSNHTPGMVTKQFH